MSRRGVDREPSLETMRSRIYDPVLYPSQPNLLGDLRADAIRLLDLLDEALLEQVEGREGMVTVYDHERRYLGCMGIETWRDALRREETLSRRIGIVAAYEYPDCGTKQPEPGRCGRCPGVVAGTLAANPLAGSRRLVGVRTIHGDCFLPKDIEFIYEDPPSIEYGEDGLPVDWVGT